MLAFPQTPHALVVMKLRRAPGAIVDTRGQGHVGDVAHARRGRHGRRRSPSQSLISAMSAGERITASLTRNPAASSMSSPGVRMVMVSAVPSTLIPSGSSAARKSARAALPPGLAVAGQRDPQHTPPRRPP